jgi:hypothetical protein
LTEKAASVDGKEVVKHLTLAFTAAVSANNADGARFCFCKLFACDEPAALEVLRTVQLPRVTSRCLHDLMSAWCKHHGVTVKLVPPRAFAASPAAASGSARPPAGVMLKQQGPEPGVGPPPTVAACIPVPIVLLHGDARSSEANRVSKHRQRVHAGENARAAAASRAPAVPRAAAPAGVPRAPAGAAPRAPAASSAAGEHATLETSFSLNLVSDVLQPERFRGFIRRVSFEMGRARVAVHALAQMVLLRELGKPGFGDIHNWNIDDYFRQWVQSLRSEYYIKSHAAGAPRNRYAQVLPALARVSCVLTM